MNNYAPRPGSAAEAALEFIRKQGGSARSKEIAQAIGVEAKSISAILSAAVDHGALVACDVAVPGTPQQKEYRLSAGGKPAPFTVTGRGRAPVAAPRAEGQEVPEAARRSAPIERRKPVGKLITGEAGREMAQEAAKPARQPRKSRKPAQPHPRGASRPKVTGKLLRAAAEGQRKTAKRLPVTEVPWKAEQPAVERPQMEPPSPFRCAVFSDGSFEIVTLERGEIWLSASETRAMVQYLRTVGHLGEAA